MMANDVNSYSRVISGVCIVVVAGMILWLCSSTYSTGIRLSVLESQFNTIQIVLTDLKIDSKANRALLVDIQSGLTMKDRGKLQ